MKRIIGDSPIKTVTTMATLTELTTPYTIQEAAALLKIGRNSAYEAARRGEIPTLRIGKRLLVPRAAFDRLLATGRAA